MEIKVFFYDKVNFLNEHSPISQIKSVEKVENRNKVILDEDTKTTLFEMYKQGYKLICTTSDQLFLEKNS